MITKTLTQVQKIDLSVLPLLKRVSVAGMIAYSLILIVQAPWFSPLAQKQVMALQDTGLVCALLTVLFMVLSITKPFLRDMGKQVEEISPEHIGQVYFICGCVSFVLCLFM
jgi:hypothetical protein